MSLLMKFLPFGLAGSLLPIYYETAGLWPRFVRRSLNIFLLMFIYMKRPLFIDLAVFLSERGDPLAERWSEKNRARERERERSRHFIAVRLSGCLCLCVCVCVCVCVSVCVQELVHIFAHSNDIRLHSFSSTGSSYYDQGPAELRDADFLSPAPAPAIASSPAAAAPAKRRKKKAKKGVTPDTPVRNDSAAAQPPEPVLPTVPLQRQEPLPAPDHKYYNQGPAEILF